MNKSFFVFFLIDLSDWQVIWHRTAILRAIAQRHRVAAMKKAA